MRNARLKILIMKQLLALILSLPWILVAQQTPAPQQSQSILISGVTAHIGNGTVINDAAIGFDQGRITYVGSASEAPSNFQQQIDGNGQHAYPGFIGMNTTLGLVEIDAVRATNDKDELGEMLPHIRAAIAYNAESQVVESVRPNGVLVAQVAPRGGRISGSSSVMQLDAWNWEDAIIKADDGIHLRWPNPFQRGRWWLGEDPSLKRRKAYKEDIQKLKDYFAAAQIYSQNSDPKHLPFAAMQGLFDGSQRLYIHANGSQQINESIEKLKSWGVQKLAIVGGHEAPMQLDILKENDIPVIIPRPHRLPENEDETLKSTFELGAELVEAGITVAIEMSGRMERMNARNLPFYAGSFAAYGVPYEKAVALLTANPAKILELDAELGTLEVGKRATLFLSKGDALDMRTNILSHAFIDGRSISLKTHQTELWERYSQKVNK